VFRQPDFVSEEEVSVSHVVSIDVVDLDLCRFFLPDPPLPDLGWTGLGSNRPQFAFLGVVKDLVECCMIDSFIKLSKSFLLRCSVGDAEDDISICLLA